MFTDPIVSGSIPSLSSTFTYSAYPVRSLSICQWSSSFILRISINSSLHNVIQKTNSYWKPQLCFYLKTRSKISEHLFTIQHKRHCLKSMKQMQIPRDLFSYNQLYLVRTLWATVRIFQLQNVRITEIRIMDFLLGDFPRDLKMLFELEKFQMKRIRIRQSWLNVLLRESDLSLVSIFLT